MRAKILTPSPFLHAHSGPVAPSWFQAVVMAGFDFLVWQALTVFRWSERGDSLGFGAERNPNAWRRLGSRSWTEPCHAGTEGFRVSLREDIDFTPRGNGAWRGERRKGRAEWRRASTVHRYTCKCGKQITKIPLSALRTQLRRASRRSRSPVYPAVPICAPSDRILVSKIGFVLRQ